MAAACPRSVALTTDPASHAFRQPARTTVAGLVHRERTGSVVYHLGSAGLSRLGHTTEDYRVGAWRSRAAWQRNFPVRASSTTSTNSFA